jgi:tRNA A37 threonylcarbamoyladenosine dehydratase
MQRILKAYVIVLGVGGVGSNVVNMLIRSGVGRIGIVDFDRVSLSSLSRHAYATL